MIEAREQIQEDHNIYREDIERRSSRSREHTINRRHRVVMTALLFTAFAFGIIISFYYAQVIMATYQIHSLQREIQTLQQETDSMQTQVAELTSLERIEKVAVNELGMVEPRGDDVIRVAVDKAPARHDSRVKNGVEKKNKPGNTENNTHMARDRNWVIQAFANLVQ